MIANEDAERRGVDNRNEAVIWRGKICFHHGLRKNVNSIFVASIVSFQTYKGVKMFGEKAFELIKQLQRAGDGPLPPFEVSRL